MNFVSVWKPGLFFVLANNSRSKKKILKIPTPFLDIDEWKKCAKSH